MSRGTIQPQDNQSSEWLTKKIEELYRQIRETEPWPETADHLLTVLSTLPNSPRQTTSSEEDYEMLSIVVNDALIGIDVMKKYPAFYARMLVDEELRNAFLDTLELLEEGDAEELMDYSAVEPFDLEIIKKVMSRPIILESAKNKVKLLWKRTAEQLQAMIKLNTLKPKEVLRSGGYSPGGDHLNILHSQVEIGGRPFDVRLEASRDLVRPERLKLMVAMNIPDAFDAQFEAAITWGSYRGTAAINQFGIGKFPPLEAEQVFTPAGDPLHGLELHLEQHR